MAELSYTERLQPSLLDRLADDNPTQTRESREARVLSIKQLRECVLRDLAWLMNTENLGDIIDFETAPEVERSVLNYGIPALAGSTLSGANLGWLEAKIREAILFFEPRMIQESLRVEAVALDDVMNNNALSFKIEGQLWAQPLPLQLFLRTDIDLETGHVAIVEQSDR